MLHELIQREECLKATAQRAADAGDWASVVNASRSLVATYRAILSSGLVPAAEEMRWTSLRDRWERIGAEAAAKVSATSMCQLPNQMPRRILRASRLQT